jgi:hypothetical protein
MKHPFDQEAIEAAAKNCHMTKEEKAHLLSVIEGIAAPIQMGGIIPQNKPPHVVAICHVLKSLVEALP